MPHETIRKVNEYVEQRQRLLNRTASSARSGIGGGPHPTGGLHLVVEDPTEISE
jgi:hypothetical protein